MKSSKKKYLPQGKKVSGDIDGSVYISFIGNREMVLVTLRKVHRAESETDLKSDQYSME
ncbi:hypothetical protein [Pedobacter duraquae]|uniref:hypothetical protein n=1 Tax=Pedobacter duraquae TaxID=425511 RepID=UPI001414F10A|nr:hypothetical protein [Pedobacter duraquae]